MLQNLYYICQNDDLGVRTGPIHRDGGSTPFISDNKGISSKTDANRPSWSVYVGFRIENGLRCSPPGRRAQRRNAFCPHWLFSSVSANWPALASLNSYYLENTNDLQANEWHTYAIVILATPTSGKLIRIVQNKAMSTTSPKNGKGTIYAFLYALAIAITVTIGKHSSLARLDLLLPILQPFPSGQGWRWSPSR
jgi:hypothetical protein